MLTILYIPDGMAVPDHILDKELENIRIWSESDEPRHIRYSTTNIFDMVMLWVAQEKLDYRRVQFAFKDKAIEIKRDGRLDEWPEGFTLDIAAILQETVLAGFTIRRRIRDEEKKTNG